MWLYCGQGEFIVPELDPRSLIVVAGLLGLLCSVILFMLRRSFPATIGGLRHWSWGMLSMVVASGLFGLSGHIPEIFSVVLANCFLNGGVMLVYVGFAHFAEREARPRLLAVTLAAAILLVIWFTYGHPSYPLRALMITSIDAVLFFACADLVNKSGPPSPAGRFTNAMFMGIGTISLLRVGSLLTSLDAPASLLMPLPTQKLYLAALSFSVLAITLGAIMMANDRLRAALEFIASHDQLTGTYARGAFLDRLEAELKRCRRTGRPPALLMCDLDNFKSINDRYGHAMGDKVIVDFTQRTRELLRGHDALGRYGGEEFIVLLPETSIEQAHEAALRICGNIAAASSPDLPRYTVSIGVAAAGDGGMTLDGLLSRTDDALYLAKANGRNRVELAGAVPRRACAAS
jgi:diguanylate cyclase (GGDEF)-like protein